jgi:hypothetical protein
VEGLEKDLAQINALASSSAERLREHRTEAAPQAKPVSAADEHEKTLAGLAIGSTWDLVLGKASTAQERVVRAQKADQYASIAADTFASIPKFSAVTSGIAHSVLLIDVSGQKSASGVVSDMALNFAQGVAFNSVSRMANPESAVGRMVTGRLGAGLSAEIATHALSGGGFGLVKSGLSEGSWVDKQGKFSLGDGLKNIAASTSVGTVIGIPAGMLGMRVGRAVTLGMGAQAEHSVLAATVQKMATGAGSGFASGSVFGGVDATRSGKSWSEIVDSTFQGGMVGMVTGGLSAGFDRTPILAMGPRERFSLAAQLEAATAARPQGDQSARNTGGLNQTEHLVERSNTVMAPDRLLETHEKLSYSVPIMEKISEFSRRLKSPVIEDRSVSRMKATAPKTHAEYQEALKKLNAAGEPLDFSKHFFDPFVEQQIVRHKVYTVEGHTTKIVVPEDYANQLTAVRALRKEAQYPPEYAALSQEQKEMVFMAMKNGDASGLQKTMSAADVSKYIRVYQAKFALSKHPLGDRALPEDLVPILDALPNRSHIKEMHLLDTRNVGDVWKSLVYDAPGFQAAATVGREGIVSLYQQAHGSVLYNNIFHEWAHVAKWQSPAFSKLFDLASVVDHEDINVDQAATAKRRATEPASESVTARGMYYPNLHSTRSQDENFAVGLGEEVMGSDPDALFDYVARAPVRGMVLANVLDRNLMVGNGSRVSTFSENMRDRVQFVRDAARSYTIGALQTRLDSGTPAQKAAAVQLMGHFGTTEQADDLLTIASNKANRIVPDWKGTAAEEAMASDKRTVAQHAFDSYVTLMNKGDGKRAEGARFDLAMEVMLNQPHLQDLAADFLLRSTDVRQKVYESQIKAYDPQSRPTEMTEGIDLIKRFGGPDRAERLLALALKKGTADSGKTEAAGPDSHFATRPPVAQSAYNAYVEVSANSYADRADFALKQGLERPSQRDLASRYLLDSWDQRTKGLGKFLAMYDMPGHVSKMQELITDNLKDDPVSQGTVFDRMMALTENDPRRQVELIGKNLHVTSLMGKSLDKLDSILSRGTSPLQLMDISAAVKERLRWENYSAADGQRLNNIMEHVHQEEKIQEALARVKAGQEQSVSAMHDLAVMHDLRAIKPLLQQALSANSMVSNEAVGALQQFNPSLVRFYAQELKRDYLANPVMTARITDLLGSKKFASTPPSSTASNQLSMH